MTSGVVKVENNAGYDQKTGHQQEGQEVQNNKESQEQEIGLDASSKMSCLENKNH